jgi:hypothetical protein
VTEANGAVNKVAVFVRTPMVQDGEHLNEHLAVNGLAFSLNHTNQSAHQKLHLKKY